MAVDDTGYTIQSKSFLFPSSKRVLIIGNELYRKCSLIEHHKSLAELFRRVGTHIILSIYHAYVTCCCKAKKRSFCLPCGNFWRIVLN